MGCNCKLYGGKGKTEKKMEWTFDEHVIMCSKCMQ